MTSFAQITSNVTVQQELQAAYGSVDNIDPFEGGLAEDHVAGSDMGPLFTTILADQFTRLRDGDRFFYLNESFNPDELNILRQGDTLAKVIEANTGDHEPAEPTSSCSQASISRDGVLGGERPADRASSPQGLAGITVQLKDSSGNVLATTVTDRRGRYSFNQLSGVSGTGDYTVTLVVPGGYSQTSTNPSAILISRGDTNVGGVNFVLAPA